jgi:hypothetical protein
VDLTFQPVSIASRHDDEGRLVFADGRLVAILVELSPMHGDMAGQWFLELAFDALDHPGEMTFATLDTAREWIADQMVREGAVRPNLAEGETSA